VLLLLLSMEIDILHFALIDAPPREHIHEALYTLWILGAIDSDVRLTKMGEAMAAYPLDAPLSKTICAASGLGVPKEAADVVALLTVGALHKVLC
jgi:HrpA-like RNA helicase